MTDAEFQAMLEEYSFDLPEDLIARHPPRERDAARLLLVDPVRGEFREESFRNLPNLLQPRDCLVLNRSKVSFRRLHVQRR
ncbi:MAG TPA: S-adenosylmethionine:tRNA ribosyltransferase-isomerase, partial [Leptospiraceae bacterium]|nr:S-adenosylmethionine:tRNA ribosyltransferase-isomerase [Leptospiraceae bacterium]